jgi:hypothetical protein
MVRSPLPSSLSNSLPVPLKAIARGFIFLFHVCIWSPSTIFLHLPPSPLFTLLPPTSTPPFFKK